MLDERMIEYVRTFIETHDPIGTKLKRRFPFRRLFGHGLRCAKWAERINAVEKGDPDVVAVSALFHDIGKSVDNSHEGHARQGAEITEAYLRSIQFDPDKTERIAAIVGNHIHHCAGDVDSIEARIVSDADVLDEMGAMTVLWDCMGLGAEEEQTYQAAYERIKGHLLDYIEINPKLLTPTGQRFMDERIAFLERFVNELALELGLDDE